MLREVKRKFELLFKPTILSIQNIFLAFNPFKTFEFKELMKHVKFSKNDVILDIGCGEGLQTLIIGKKCKKIYGIDVDCKSLSIAKLRLLLTKRKVNCELQLTNLENANFEDFFFNKIFSICVLEHISNYFEVIKECHRTLKKNGQLILSVDSLSNINNKKILMYHQKKYNVVKYFNEEGLKHLLKTVGFKKIIVYPIFRSKYAKILFIKGLKNNNNFGYVKSILLFFILKYNENFKKTHQNSGLFLVAKCYK